MTALGFLGAAVVVWSVVAAGAAAAIGRVIRHADDTERHLTLVPDYVPDDLEDW